jgi:phosphoribosyl 1,2-cyclic phosphodiesterase
MPFYHKLGQIPHKRHTVFRQPDGSIYHEQLFGTIGFDGMSSLLYHLKPPTIVKEIRGNKNVAPEIALEKNMTMRSLMGYQVKPKEDYLNALSNFRVCVTPVEHHHGWSLSATDAMTKGCPVLFGECDNYREINPNGLFYNNDVELEEMLDKLLDDDDYQFAAAQQCLGRAYELSDTGHFNELKSLLLDADLKPKNYKDI